MLQPDAGSILLDTEHVWQLSARQASRRIGVVLTPELIWSVYGVRAEVAPHPRTGRLHVVFLPRYTEVSR